MSSGSSSSKAAARGPKRRPALPAASGASPRPAVAAAEPPRPPAAPGVRLPREFYARPDVLAVARELLGKRLVVPGPGGQRVSGLVVETEAYAAPEDKASHAYGGRRTARTETMFMAGGAAYVYFVYGMHHQFNVVTGPAELPHAVLVRAVEPEEGIELMRERRPVRADRELTSGPGKLCRALGITRDLDGADLTAGREVWLEDIGREVAPAEIASGPRVGIAYAEEYAARPWRFWLAGNPYVSRPR
ncbi:MAG TPA: DNA-3-methyladenine glycosylase [Pyrinomonadaceae bacterium]|nr:DNA-3-methyladenine glycosylase [Pyrinomonadaceae bacterium]